MTLAGLQEEALSVLKVPAVIDKCIGHSCYVGERKQLDK